MTPLHELLRTAVLAGIALILGLLVAELHTTKGLAVRVVDDVDINLRHSEMDPFEITIQR